MEMRKIFRKRNIFYALFALLIGSLSVVAFMRTSEPAYGRDEKSEIRNTKLRNVAYVTSGGTDIPDPTLMTDIYYAFGEINPDFKSVDVINPERLRQIVALKEQNPDLNVMICIGGFRKAGFSEMAGNAALRKAFVADLKKVVNEYGLDGVDFDWEFPTTTAGGHTASPADTQNYVKLVEETRQALGDQKQISYYSNNSGKWINHKAMEPYVDYVMVSGYNIAAPPAHQSNLYTSSRFRGWSVDKAVEVHKELGVPYSKILMGIPFFYRTQPVSNATRKDVTYFERRDLPDSIASMADAWDEEAQAPYLETAAATVFASYDSPRSVEAKGSYIRNKGLAGAFYWSYDSEDSTHVMAKTMKRVMME